MPRNSRPIEFWLEQITRWAGRLSAHMDGISREAFLTDLKTQDAVSWCISCIGEASGKILEIEPDLERRYPELELTAAYYARNRYVHGYFDLDEQQIWSTATDAVPELALQARRVLSDDG